MCSEKDRYIPAAVRRTLRKETCFCCPFCGSPILEYHHIIPWAKRQEHFPEDMVALCPTCHTEYGDNPLKRTRIKEIRDWWYEVIETKYGLLPGDAIRLEAIVQRLKTIEERTESIPELKERLKLYTNSFIDKITPNSTSCNTN